MEQFWPDALPAAIIRANTTIGSRTQVRRVQAVMLILVLVLKDSLRTKFKSLSLSLQV